MVFSVQPMGIPLGFPKIPQFIIDWVVKLVIDQLNKLVQDGTLETAVQRAIDWLKVHLLSLGKQAAKIVLDRALAYVRNTPNKLDDRVVELVYKQLGIPLPQ